jgi:hypothetical protein
MLIAMALSSNRPVKSWLAALVGIENLGPAVPGERLLDRCEAELDLHRDRDAPRQDPAAEPVDNRGQVDEAVGHRDVGDVHRPHLVGPRDRQPTQQVRVDLMTPSRLRRVWTTIERCDAHPLHHPGHPLAT